MSFIKVAKVSEITAGTMKHIESGGKEICIVNVSGKFYAIGDRCGHENARLSRGSLMDTIVTCPMHSSQFDVTTGKLMSGPVEAKIEGAEKLPSEFQKVMVRMAEIMAPVKTYDAQIFPVRIDGSKIFVNV